MTVRTEASGDVGRLRVLELSDVEGAAAFAGKLFARWGHEVVRVEAPDRPPPERARELYLHGGKRRVALDLGSAEGRERLDAVARTSDVLLTDHRPAVIRERGLFDAGGASGAPVRVSVTPFGLTGPYADAEATSASLLAMGGYTFLMGEPGEAPLTLPGRYPEYQAGAYAYIAALACALRARRQPDLEPAEVDVSMLEVLATLHQSTYTKWHDTGTVRARAGNRMDAAPNSFFPAKDGWVGVSFQQQFWFAFAHLIGRPELAEDDHPLASNAGRLKHYDELAQISIEAFSERAVDELFEEAQGTWRVPIGKLVSLGDLLDDRHLAEREFWRPLEGARPDEAHLKVPATPFRFVGEPLPVERAPEPAGASTDAVLREVADAATPAGTPRLAPVRRPARPARPLEGVRVLDLTRIWSGPVGGRVLADLGAEVIKVEAPLGRGPSTVPPGTVGYARNRSSEPWNFQSVFNQLQRNRLDLCVDLKRDEGRELFLRLVGVSDVVLENFSARAMGSLRLGYDALREANPRIVYVPMPAFGRRGPYRDYIGLGTSIEPMAGIPSLMGYPGGPPRTAAIALPDPIAGLGAAAAVLTALERRDRTGEGAELDLSQHEGAIGYIGEYAIERQLTGEEPERLGNWHADYAPHGIYRCAGDDEWVQLAARDEREWRELCDLAGAAGAAWADDPRLATLEARRAHRAELDAVIEAWTCGQEQIALARLLLEAGLPAAGVLTAPELYEDPHLAARGYFAELQHPVTGTQRFDGAPVAIDGDRGYADWLPAPTLGEHNRTLLRDLLAMPDADIDALEASGVLADRPPA